MEKIKTTEIIEIPEWLIYYSDWEYPGILILNPPTKGNHIDYIFSMYNNLKSGESIGVVVTLVWKRSKTENEVEFKQWLITVDAKIIAIDKEVFRAIGILFPTNMLIIKKP